MGFFEKFAEHFITQWPTFSLWLTAAAIVVLFLATPIFIFLLFSEKYNKGRYIFEKKNGTGNHEALYMLDTMKGKLYHVDGIARYKRMHEYDWKEARKEIDEKSSQSSK